MKILYLYQHFVLPNKSGITRTYEFARRLASFGHEVHLIAADENSNQIHPAPYTTEHSGIHIHWLPIPYKNAMSFKLRISAFIKYAWGAFILGSKIQSDLIYVSSPPLTATLPALFIGRRNKIPIVVEIRDLWPDLPIVFKALKNRFTISIARTLESLAYRSAKHVIALSPGIRAAIASRGTSLEKISVIPNSCDIEFFRTQETETTHLPESIKNDDLVVLYPGTLGIANGVSYIVKMAQHTLKTHPKIKFVIIGDGKEKPMVKTLAEHVGVLNNNLFLMDPIPKEKIPALYRRASLILNTLVNHQALWNSSPNKFFDSLAAGRPVAINFRGWLADLITENEIGLVLDPEDCVKAAQQITQALSLPLWTEKSGRNALKLGLAKFDRDILATQLNQILLDVLKQSDSHATLRKVSR